MRSNIRLAMAQAKHNKSTVRKEKTMIKSYNFTAKDNFNSIAGIPMQSKSGETITVVGAAIDERPNADGEAQEVGLLVGSDGTVYTGISGTAIRGIEMLIDYMKEENLTEVEIQFVSQQSKQGRTFITLRLV